MRVWTGVVQDFQPGSLCRVFIIESLRYVGVHNLRVVIADLIGQNAQQVFITICRRIATRVDGVISLIHGSYDITLKSSHGRSSCCGGCSCG